MDVRALLEDFQSRVHEHVHDVAADLTAEQLALAPEPGANPIGWQLWHLTRVADAHLSELLESDQVWATSDWAGKFGLPPDPKNSGYGHSAEQVGRVRPESAGVVTGYFDQVEGRVLDLLATVDDAALDQVVDERWEPPVTLGVRLVSILDDAIQHAGQAAYVKGLIDRR